ncbi:MAG: PhoH family protein [Bacteroidota bacterium]|nr:PhoH family protein [Bacteroidota bacterium]GIR59518.1 MAG: phosphate starvation protein PhoH [Crocinitomicaceae bacterium]MEC7063251.1 PhoH family protein [Bacteroidota bacterium]MEC7128510.1 PhoH family protein [Bacteroidota bacterium]MEC7527585.1 PhoH family protein [Bacteroidota bacterium]|tara:strand:+ start:403 stop:1740 length:1338 start_codon:yes stop_codon:yes gene_type:complete
MAKKSKKPKKIFVLDTSVILHDHNVLDCFEENDIAIPITVLEELDNFKRGNDTKNYEAREFIRILDRLSNAYTLQDWIPINGEDKGKFKIILENDTNEADAVKIFGNKNDHHILNAALSLKITAKDSKVILVSKDINLRLKAKALNITAEDFETGKIDRDSTLYTGKQLVENIESEYINKLYKQGNISDTNVIKDKLTANGFYIMKNGKSSVLSYYNPLDDCLERVEKQYVYGIKPRNAEQTFALHALLNPDIKLVTLQGVAGTGKTLLALASALEQHNLYHQIVLARPIVPLSNKDIGYLPGNADEKINPYMQPLFDNLKFIKNQFGQNEKKYRKIEEMEDEGKLNISALAFIRGRSLSNVIFIVDEAQNLTPHEVKTIITRAGENTKIIFTGDVFQIDTPYLDEQSNGLSYLIDRLKGNELFAHITLEKGERSELANLANELL